LRQGDLLISRKNALRKTRSDKIRLRGSRIFCWPDIGGTMFPCQWTPKFSATYLEIEEHFGGFNFGGGNGQLDLDAMEFDWACG
jgi:hypothetical protein